MILSSKNLYLNDDLALFSYAPYDAILKRWNGSSWVKAKMKRYNGSEFEDVDLEHFDTTWKTVDTSGI